jgi:hypothetical protein
LEEATANVTAADIAIDETEEVVLTNSDIEDAETTVAEEAYPHVDSVVIPQPTPGPSVNQSSMLNTQMIRLYSVFPPHNLKVCYKL